MDEGKMVLLDGKDVDEDGWGHAGAAGRKIRDTVVLLDGREWQNWTG
jgi:hypothetical protein